MEVITSKEDYLALQGMYESEGYRIFNDLLSKEMKSSYGIMMKEDSNAETIKRARDKMLGLKLAQNLTKNILDTFEGRFDEDN